MGQSSEQSPHPESLGLSRLSPPLLFLSHCSSLFLTQGSPQSPLELLSVNVVPTLMEDKQRVKAMQEWQSRSGLGLPQLTKAFYTWMGVIQ